MNKLKTAVMQGEAVEAQNRLNELLQEGVNPEKLVGEALVPAMDEVGRLFQEGQYFIPNMLVAARAMNSCMEILKPLLGEGALKSKDKVVLGTVRGDLHDIGKNLVAMMLKGAGFEVIDLGIDVSPEDYVRAIKEENPGFVGLSALLTTTMLSMGEIINAISVAGLRRQVKIMVGGAPVTQEFADSIGADFYGADAAAAREYIRLASES